MDHEGILAEISWSMMPKALEMVRVVEFQLFKDSGRGPQRGGRTEEEAIGPRFRVGNGGGVCGRM